LPHRHAAAATLQQAPLKGKCQVQQCSTSSSLLWIEEN